MNCAFCSLICEADHSSPACDLQALRLKQLGLLDASLDAHRHELTDGLRAQIDGKPVLIDAAIDFAAKLLSQRRRVAFSGHVIDVHASRGLIAIARKISSVIDMANTDAAMATAVAIQRAGMVCETLGEARFRADVIVLIGTDAMLEAFPRLPERLLDIPAASSIATRKVVLLGQWSRQSQQKLAGDRRSVTAVHSNLAELANSLTGLQYAASNTSIIPTDAQNVVVAWSPDALQLDRLDLWTETLLRWIAKSNRGANFAALPLAGRGTTFQQVCTWATGFPGRIRFDDGHPEYSPQRFQTPQMLDDLPCDGFIWIDQAYEPSRATSGFPPTRCPDVLVTVNPIEQSPHPAPRVVIPIGAPGIDHDAVLFRADAIQAQRCPAIRRSSLPSAGWVLDRLHERMFANATSGDQHARLGP